jgi:hypothetical protein
MHVVNGEIIEVKDEDGECDDI